MKRLTSILLSVIILGVGVGGMFLFGQKPEVPTQEPTDENAAIPVVTEPVEQWDAPFEICIVWNESKTLKKLKELVINNFS